MSQQWTRFINALETKGVSFEQVLHASDRRAVIHVAGFTDPLAIAVLETEWQKKAAAQSRPSATTKSTGTGRPPSGSGSAPDKEGSRRTSASDAAGAPVAAAESSSSTTTRPLLPPSSGAAGAASSLPPGATQPVDAVPFQNSPGVPLAKAADLAAHALQDIAQLHSLPEEVQDAVVTTEVLAAAVGFGGALLQATPDGFAISSYVPLSLRSLCQTVLPVADAYVALRKVEEAEYLGRSLVAMALGEVVSEICTSYAHQITKLQRWSEERTMRLLGVVSEIIRVGHHIVRLRQLLPPDLVLPRDGTAAATGLTGQLGPRLLNHLGEQAARYAGNREESELLQLLQRRALVPYLRLLHRWMHEGVLEDPYGEFFITEANEPVSSAAVTAAATASSLAAASSRRRQVAQLFPDLTTLSSEYAAYPSSAGVGTGLGSSGAGGAGTHGQQQQHQQADVLRFERRFSLNKLMIPSFLVKPSRVAKMIFFAGKYCCLLREYNGTLPVFGEVGESMLVWSGVDELHRTIQESFEVVSGAVIQLLFSSSVDLLGHLSSLKSYFLQERGDWVTDFLDSAEALLESSPDKVKAHSVRVLLQGAVARGCATDPYHALIGCSFADASLEQQVLQRAAKSGANAKRNEEDEGQGEDGLVIVDAEAPLPRGSTGTVDSQRCMELLQLDIDLQWPLSLVLDAPVIRRFNSVFRLLTWVKVCERNLCSLWYTNEVLAGFSAAYGIKHQMIQFLRQFQFYAAHFVLEPLWGRLVSRIGQADSIFAISQALDDFFDGVELGMVMSSPHRFRSLAKILDLTVRFGEVGRHSSTATMPLIESTLHSVEDSFLRALSELASPIGPDYSQLVPLLTWIDFSGFYDRNNIYHVQHGAGEAPRRL